MSELSSYKLEYISTEYRKFSKGQLVDDDQFNEFLDFFEDQDRLSRVMLQGVGVVCGFKPTLGYANDKIKSIFLSQGIAITTDGDLLTLNTKSRSRKLNVDPDASELKTIDFSGKLYTHWKAYDNYKVMYPPFYNASVSSTDQIELWELSDRLSVKDGFQPLTAFDNLEDMCLLLYLEDYEKEVKPCKGVDCDNHGIQQVRNLKVLLTTVAGIEKILEADTVSPHPVLLNLLGEEKIKRVVLTKTQNTAESIRAAYSSAISQSNYAAIIESVNSICTMMGKTIIDETAFVNSINSLITQPVKIQYAYEAVKDLIDTYAEIVAQLSKSFMKSFPDVYAFPKHIMLGGLTSDDRFDNKKHQFYSSPALDNEKTEYSRLLLLIERFRQQVQAYKGPITLSNGAVKITPSQLISPLGEKAIPFYYTETNDLLAAWDYDKTRNRASGTNLRFSTTLLATKGDRETPTSYNKPFYRIEGHQGSDYDEIVTNLRQIKEDNQLGFDIMAVSLTQLLDNKDVSKASFSDYIEKHPGIEHLGGVKRGGTFVVVYESEASKAVIADFSLPYVCCTPKSDVALSLPMSTLCNNAAPVIFKITPANGVVKGYVRNETTGAIINTSSTLGVQKVNGQYMFNPGLVEDEFLNKEIEFTVNAKQTDCTVEVLPAPEVTIVASIERDPEAGSSITTVSFAITGENMANYDYKWDFLGNGLYVSVKPDKTGIVRNNYVKVDFTKEVRVLVSGNGCSEIVLPKNWHSLKNDIVR
ncbi:hypothetical protein ACLI1A_11725 [Flavobacterium sp. RHBU_3]|uniref:hypothetical protein n=1 Tax=Flavobacterium sp. RHBU_3 TaxID=3391184 RepID=UPI0039850746